MLYHVSRDGQSYGPYTLEDLQRYVVSGNVLPTDMARSEEMTEWVSVAQLLGSVAPPVAYGAPAGIGAYPPAAAFPDPPSLHWGLVLLFGVITCGLFIVIWDIVQAAWVRKVRPGSNGLFYYLAADVLSIVGNSIRFRMMMVGGFANPHMAFGAGLGLLTLILLEAGRFDLRNALEEHYNSAEPLGLSLGPVMTFFFGGLYFQYHLTRIAELKRMARYRTGSL